MDEMFYIVFFFFSAAMAVHRSSFHSVRAETKRETENNRQQLNRKIRDIK